MVGLHQKDLGQTRCSLAGGIRKWNKMDQHMPVLKMSGKVRGSKARAVTSRLPSCVRSNICSSSPAHVSQGPNKQLPRAADSGRNTMSSSSQQHWARVEAADVEQG